LEHVHFAARPEGGVDVVASDTHRLGCYTFADIDNTPLSDRGAGARLAGLGGRGLAFVRSHVAKAGKVTLGFTDDFAVVRAGNWASSIGPRWTLYTRLIEGMFPRYRDVMPDYNTMPGKAWFDRKALVSAIKATLPILGESGGIHLRKADDSEEAALVEVWADDVCKYSTAVPAAARKLPHVQVNAHFLLDCLAGSDRAMESLRFDKRGDGPCVMRLDNYDHILMPINGRADTDASKADRAAYAEALAEPDQDAGFLADSTVMRAVPAMSIRPPSYKAVVARARADAAYMRDLLAALGVNTCGIDVAV
jgi:DNA polymerase sliding clamp subunit (PCNA homolog)